MRHLRTAQPRCGLDQCIQHRLQIECRAADDLEHIARRGLVFERFFEIARALAQFVEQPCILHCDDRLRREALQERDLLVGERTDFRATCHDIAEEHVILAQRYEQTGAHAPKLECTLYDRIVELRRIYHYCEGRTLDQLAHRMLRIRLKRTPYEICKGLRHSAHSHRSEGLSISYMQAAVRGAAEAARLLQDRVEYRREVTGGRVDDPQPLGGRGLLLQCLARLIDQPRIFHCD